MTQTNKCGSYRPTIRLESLLSIGFSFLLITLIDRLFFLRFVCRSVIMYPILKDFVIESDASTSVNQ